MALFEVVFRVKYNHPLSLITEKNPVKIYHWCNDHHDIMELVLQRQEQYHQMRVEMERLFATFSDEELVGAMALQYIELKPETIRQWRSRGRVSASAAHYLCRNKRIAGKGFTREALRPDVREWVI